MIRWDAEGRMERIERTDVTPAVVLGEYEYDAEGRRVKRVTDGTATYYIYDARTTRLMGGPPDLKLSLRAGSRKGKPVPAVLYSGRG